MQKLITLYKVLIYLQKQLDILAQTYSYLQLRRRALYLMFFSDGKKPEDDSSNRTWSGVSGLDRVENDEPTNCILQKIPTFHRTAPDSPFLLLHRTCLVCAFACA